MMIALDYDGTYTADRPFWDSVVALARKHGHEVKMVTMRTPEQSIECVGMDVIYTSKRAKAGVFKADVWIDDKPYFIGMDG